MTKKIDSKKLTWEELLKENIIGRFIYFEPKSEDSIIQGQISSIVLNSEESKIVIKLKSATKLNITDEDAGWIQIDNLLYELDVARDKPTTFTKYGNRTIEFPANASEVYDLVYIDSKEKDLSKN